MSKVLTDLHAAGSQNSVCQPVTEYELNPKSITMAELYGRANPDTNEWKDGIVAQVARVCIKDTTDHHKWIIFDGPIDTLWIESMNSVLDDSKLLCLDNGERIKLNNTIHMVFEAMDLAVASPATVSRLGMVYVDQVTVGWKSNLESFLLSDEENGGLPNAKAPEVVGWIRDWSHKYLPKLFMAMKKEFSELISSFEANRVSSMCSMLRSCMLYGGPKGKGIDWNLTTEELEGLVQLVWAYALIWGCAGNIATKDQAAFDKWFRESVKDVPMSTEGTVYDFFLDYEELRFVPISEHVPVFKYDSKQPFFTILVPTVDTVRLAALLEQSLAVNRPMLFNGTSGVGKSVMITDCLTKIKEAKSLVVVPLQFSAQTSSSRTQEMVHSKLEKKRKNTFGAPPGHRVVLFVDDLTMPKLEVFGAAPPVELLRQLMGQGGYYDREKLNWLDVVDMTPVAACREPGGGSNNVTPRLLRFFHLVCVPDVSHRSMSTMFNTILGGFLSEGFSPSLKKLQEPCISGTIELFQHIIGELLPTPTRCHYTFNLRDVSKVFQGMLSVTPKSCQKEDTLAKLWVHECARCFHDRLIDQGDKAIFYNKVTEILKNRFHRSWEPSTMFGSSPLMFADYLKGPAVPVEDRMYEEITDRAKLSKSLDDFLDDYNLNTAKPLPLVLFMDCIDHVNRIARVLRQPRGNALLVGVGGSGKQSVTRLASHVAAAKCVGIELTRGYDGAAFKEDLKKMYFLAGVDGERVAFLFTDSQIVEEGFLEDLNNILNSGEVPSLFALDEKMQIVDGIRDYVKELGLPETADICYEQFILRVRDNLHICLCMSPVGEAFRQRCRMFPSLVNCCTIDWFNEWPDDALLAVATDSLAQLDLGSA